MTSLAALGFAIARRESAPEAGMSRYIVQLGGTDPGEADSFLYYLILFVEGESLRARLDPERQRPLAIGPGPAAMAGTPDRSSPCPAIAPRGTGSSAMWRLTTRTSWRSASPPQTRADVVYVENWLTEPEARVKARQ